MKRPIEILSKQPTTYTESDENAYLHSHIIDAMYEYARLCCEEQIKACDKRIADNLGLAKTPSDYSVLNCPNVVDNE